MEAWLALALTGAIAAVFTLSGVSKLITPSSTVQAAITFGLPRAVANGSTVRLLAVAEVVLAAGLIAASDWVYSLAVFASLVFCAAFVIIAIYALRLPETLDCGCFGDLVESRTGVGMLVRNVALLFASILLVWLLSRGISVGAIPMITAAEGPVPSYALAVGGGLLAAGLLVVAPASGRRADRIPASTPEGSERHVGQLDVIPDGLTTGTTLLLRPGCSGCEEVIRRLESLVRAHPDSDIGANILIDATREGFAEYHPELAEHSRFGLGELQETLSIRGLPAAVFVEPDGRFMRRVGTAAVLELLPVHAE